MLSSLPPLPPPAAAAAAAGAPAGSVFVKRAGDARARFAEVEIFETDTVTRLADRASRKLDWRTSAAYVDLYLVKPAGGELDFTTPTQAQIDPVIADGSNVLGEAVDCPHAHLRAMFMARRFVFFQCVAAIPLGAPVLAVASLGATE